MPIRNMLESVAENQHSLNTYINRYVILLISTLCLSLNYVYAFKFNDTLSVEQNITQGLYDYLNATKQEKLFVHVDKESCQAGDTLWFKGYLLSAATNLPADLSRYIYVELADRTNTIHWREKIGLSGSDSTFSGFFPVSENLKQGDYIFHAYTYWMQNQDDAFHFTKRIRIVNPYDHKVRCNIEVVSDGGAGRRVLRVTFLNKDGERYENLPFLYKIPGETPDHVVEWSNTGYNGISRITIKDSTSDHIWIRSANSSQWDIEQYLQIPGARIDYDVQFFPEGGSLISNHKQRIAFKALRRDGLGLKVRGVIQDSDGVHVANIESNALGMGSVELVLSQDKSYKAIFEGEDGNKKEFSIPQNVSSGSCALKLNISGESISYDILSNAISNFSAYRLLIHSKGIPMAIFNAESMRNKSMNLSGAPEGILHFVLVDSALNSISERLWFHRNPTREYIEIEPPRSRVKPREDAHIAIQLCSKTPFSVNGDFSVSVINTGQSRNEINGGGIDAYTLLTSDLQGYVEQPGYYFADSEQYRERELDDLMLTQGWCRFDVTNILNDSDNAPHNPFYMERGQFLSGHVKNFRGKNSVNSEIILIGTNGIVRELKTDSTGHFVENDLWYDIGTRFIVQAISEKGRQNQELQLDDPEFRPFAFKNIIGESVDNASFYERYGKDYIFSDAGERITTLGVVRVYGNGIAKMQSDIIKNAEYESRRNFLLGLTSIWNYGGVPGYWRKNAQMKMHEYYRYIYRIALVKRTDKLEKKMKDGNFNYYSNFYSNTYMSDEMHDMAFYHDNIYHSAVNEPMRNGIMNGEKASTIINHHNSDSYQGILGIKLYHPASKVNVYSDRNRAIDAQGIIAVPVYDIAVSYVEYQWNLQTIVPFAPQQQNVEFYKPSYNVATELLKEVVDEKITRYWNPNVKLSSEYPYTVAFPTAAGDGNQTYTITIEGITENGTPIHHSFQYSL